MANENDRDAAPPPESVVGTLVANLAARSGQLSGEAVLTEGWEARGDTTSGSYYFASGVSSGADGRTKINAPNGQWQRRIRNVPFLDVARDFGCRESSSDNGPNINEAVAWAKSHGHRSIKIPLGAWPVRTQIRPDDTDMVLFGDGPNCLLVWDSTRDYCVYAGNRVTGGGTANSLRLANFQIYLNAYDPANPNGVGALRIQGYTRGRVENLKLMTNMNFSGKPFGTAILSSNGTWVNVISSGLIQGFERCIWFAKFNDADECDPSIPWGAYNSNLISGLQCSFCDYGIVVGDEHVGETQQYLGAGLKISHCTIEDALKGAIWIASGYGVQVDQTYFESNKNFNVRIGSAEHAAGAIAPRGCAVTRCEIFDVYDPNVGIDLVKAALPRVEQNTFYGNAGGICMRLSEGADVVNPYVDGARLRWNNPHGGSIERFGLAVNTDYEEAGPGSCDQMRHKRKSVDSSIEMVYEGQDVTVRGGCSASPIETLRCFVDSGSEELAVAPVEMQRYLTVTKTGPSYAAEYRQIVPYGGGIIVHLLGKGGGVEIQGRLFESFTVQDPYSPATWILSRAMVARIAGTIGTTRPVMAIPTIEPGLRDGQVLYVFNVGGTDAWQLYDESYLEGSSLMLGGPTAIDIGPSQSRRFVWVAATQRWYLQS